MGAYQLQGAGTISICQKTVVSNAIEPFGDHVHQETPDEFKSRQGNWFAFSAVPVVLPGECDVSISKTQETTVGDCDAMGVAAQILQNLLGPCKRGLAVNDPGFLSGCPEMFVEVNAGVERSDFAGKRQFPLSVSPIESLQ